MKIIYNDKEFKIMSDMYFWIIIIICVFIFAGEPDLHDKFVGSVFNDVECGAQVNE